jgi:hypothetical protein
VIVSLLGSEQISRNGIAESYIYVVDGRVAEYVNTLDAFPKEVSELAMVGADKVDEVKVDEVKVDAGKDVPFVQRGRVVGGISVRVMTFVDVCLIVVVPFMKSSGLDGGVGNGTI